MFTPCTGPAIISSATDEVFWLGGGDDVVNSAGGNDQVPYCGLDAADVVVSYDATNMVH